MNNPNTAYAVRGAACLALLLILLGLGAMATLACASLASNEWRWGAAAFDAQHAFRYGRRFRHGQRLRLGRQLQQGRRQRNDAFRRRVPRQLIGNALERRPVS